MKTICLALILACGPSLVVAADLDYTDLHLGDTEVADVAEVMGATTEEEDWVALIEEMSLAAGGAAPGADVAEAEVDVDVSIDVSEGEENIEGEF